MDECLVNGRNILLPPRNYESEQNLTKKCWTQKSFLLECVVLIPKMRPVLSKISLTSSVVDNSLVHTRVGGKAKSAKLRGE